MTSRAEEFVDRLRAASDQVVGESYARLGIKAGEAIGVSVPRIRKLAAKTDADHRLALELWRTAIREARIAATLVDEPDRVTSSQMDAWARDCQSWDLVDACCTNLFRKTPYARDKIWKWSRSRKEFVKRSGFVLVACLAIHEKQAGDAEFQRYLELVRDQAWDERHYVKKAVNWALREVGKRNKRLNSRAISLAEELAQTDDKSSRWIGRHALRELSSESVQARLRAG